MSNEIIKGVVAYEVLDSRGNPTLATEITLSNNTSSTAFVPSGASTGKHESIEKRDHDPKRYLGKGVSQAVSLVNGKIRDLITGLDPFNQKELDSILCKADGTDNKSKLGSNTLLSVSLANLRVSSKCQQLPLFEYINKLSNEFFIKPIGTGLPVPMMNILNGGVHADNKLDFQEFMIQPLGFQNLKSSIRCGVEVFHELGNVLKKKNLSTSVGDEGGYAPKLNSTEEALELIIQAIELAGYKPGSEVFICLDCASSELFGKKKYSLKGEEREYETLELISYLKNLRSKFPISSIEDGLDEDDWNGWKKLTEELGNNTQLVGDDLFVTNETRIKKGIRNKAANSVLIKMNQTGTVSETLKAISLTKDNNFRTIISHRSGETEDTSIADLSVGVNSGQIKTGAPSRSERGAKYNRLLIIEEKFKLKFGVEQ